MPLPVHAANVAIPVGRQNSNQARELHVYHWNYAQAEDYVTASSESPGSCKSTTIIVVYHGFLAHGYYPTVRYAAEALASAGYTVVAADLPGHGKSTCGLRGYLPSPDELVQIGLDIADYAGSLLTCLDSEKKMFLMGSSLGGAMALSVAQRVQQQQQQQQQQQPRYSLAGVVLLAPMLRLGIDTPTRYLLSFLATLLPTLQAIPSSSTSMEKQYRDARKRKECYDDPLSISGSTIRIGSARTCVELAQRMEEEDMAASFTAPCLVMVALEDVVVDSQGAIDFYDKCGSTDKTLKKYPALHGLLCEPSPLCDTIEQDLLVWIQQRA